MIKVGDIIRGTYEGTPCKWAVLDIIAVCDIIELMLCDAGQTVKIRMTFSAFIYLGR